MYKAPARNAHAPVRNGIILCNGGLDSSQVFVDTVMITWPTKSTPPGSSHEN